MAIENERKFVLRDHEPLLARCREGWPELRLQQFYLSPEGRFRLVECDGRIPERIFTYKRPTARGLLEIETGVTDDDFAIALAEAKEVLTKMRFDVTGGEGHWSVDFLTEGHGGPVYFALAEVEFPVGGSFRMPEFIEPHVELEVPHHENPAFSNARLIDRAYAVRAVAEYRARVARGDLGG